MDLRGHGKSIHEHVKSSETYSFRLIVDDIHEVLNYHDIQQAHFVGVSLGTILIREYVDVYPDKVMSASYSGAITDLDLRSKFLIQFGHLSKQVIPFHMLYKLFAWIIMPGKAHASARALFNEQAGQISQDEFLRWFELTRTVDEILIKFNDHQILTPSLFVMGDRDHLFLSMVKNLIQSHPHYNLVIIENCGHVCNVEKPVIFNREILSFITKIHARHHHVHG